MLFSLLLLISLALHTTPRPLARHTRFQSSPNPNKYPPERLPPPRMASELTKSDASGFSVSSRVYPVLLTASAIIGALFVIEATKVIAASVFPLFLLFGKRFLIPER